jgi:CO/xanthine dehydrogenase FAD-binding subunit
MKPFKYFKAKTLAEAVALLYEHPGITILAGGTDLFVKMKAGQFTPNALLDIVDIEEMRVLEISEQEIYIGAAVKILEIEKHARLKEYLPSLTGAAFSLGAPQIRNLATVGGNICNASPSADLLPPLYAYGAEVIISGKAKERRLPIEEFLLESGKTALQEGELLKGISMPTQASTGKSIYLKHTLKRSMDIAVVNTCVYVDGVDPVRECRIVLGAVGPVPLRATPAEQFISGKTLNEVNISLAASMARDVCQPIDDIRTTAEYRREIVEVLCRRGLTAIM